MEDILHIDMDAFYASIEERNHPEYKNKPLVVAGDIDNRSVISTANYTARRHNIYSAMPLQTALKKCPSLIIINPDFKKYVKTSDCIYQIIQNYSPEIEKASIDEFYMDVSGSLLLFGTSENIAKKIKKHIFNELQLTCSIGISYNKLLAKISSDINKPDGLTVINKNNFNNLIDNLKIEKIPGIGKKTAGILHQNKVYYIKELRNLSIEKLNKLFGINGIYFYDAVRGIDNSKLTYNHDIKSISNEITLKYDTTDFSLIKKIMLNLSDHIARRLREKNIKGKVLKIKLRYYDFKTTTRQISFKKYINTASDIYKFSFSIIKNLIHHPVRLIGIGITSLKNEKDDFQLTIFNNKTLEFEKNIDTINKKFGNETLKRGSLL